MRIRPDRRLAALALPLVVVSIALLLRLDAITRSYGPVERPGWLRATQTGLSPALGALRPAGVTRERVGAYPHRDAPPSQYISDPYTYLIWRSSRPTCWACRFRHAGSDSAPRSPWRSTTTSSPGAWAAGATTRLRSAP